MYKQLRTRLESISSAWLRALLFLSSDVSRQSLAREIDEELTFHLASLADKHMADGLSSADAWQKAREQFGSVPYYAEACRHTIYGDEIMAHRILLACVVGLSLLVGWLLFEVRSLREAQGRVLAESAQQRARLAVAQAERGVGRSDATVRLIAAEEKGDLAGSVIDDDGKALEGAQLLIILKTWPGGRYRQQAFSAASERDGKFRMPKLIPGSGQFAVQIAAVKDGYALASIYELRKDGGARALPSIEFKLAKASPIVLSLRDKQGQPLAGAKVAAGGRKTADGNEHAVYFQASEPIQRTTDAEGHVELTCFTRGDTAELYVQVPGEDWKSATLTIPPTGDSVELSASALQ